MPASSGSFGNGTQLQCTAKSRRTGERCRGIAVNGSTGQKCRMHGGHGAKVGGANNAGFKHGRHSRYLPSHLDELYQEAISNPELLDMTENVALLDMKVKAILAEVKEGDPAPRWAQIADLLVGIKAGALSGDTDLMTQCITEIDKLLDAGQKWDAAWDRILETMEQMRKLTDTHTKQKKELNQMVPIERVVVLMAAVGHAVKRNVKDPDAVAAVYRELAMLHGGDNVKGMGRKRLPPGAPVFSPGPDTADAANAAEGEVIEAGNQ